MTTIKEKLSLAIESTPDTILEQVLDYLEYLKAKANNFPTDSAMSPDGEPILRGSQAKDLLKFANSWQGEDFEECLQLVYHTRSQTDF